MTSLWCCPNSSAWCSLARSLKASILFFRVSEDEEDGGGLGAGGLLETAGSESVSGGDPAAAGGGGGGCSVKPPRPPSPSPVGSCSAPPASTYCDSKVWNGPGGPVFPPPASAGPHGILSAAAAAFGGRLPKPKTGPNPRAAALGQKGSGGKGGSPSWACTPKSGRPAKILHSQSSFVQCSPLHVSTSILIAYF